jgi:hypothetical protein
MKFSIFRALVSIGALLLVFSPVCLAQKAAKGEAPKPGASAPNPPDNPVRLTPAYAEVLLLKTETESEIESFVIDYTEEYPKLKESRYELTLIKRDMDRLLAVKSADTPKLTLALGKLIVRKIGLEVDLWSLRLKYNEDHPDVKRAKRRVEIFEASVKEIMG